MQVIYLLQGKHVLQEQAQNDFQEEILYNSPKCPLCPGWNLAFLHLSDSYFLNSKELSICMSQVLCKIRSSDLLSFIISQKYVTRDLSYLFKTTLWGKHNVI